MPCKGKVYLEVLVFFEEQRSEQAEQVLNIPVS